ncbi:MAG: Phosphotransferase system, phosphocarrier protein HPr [Pelosinus sp.]|jgi:phosphocarrier protein|nr:Phosphotransferase system, phosphocarrier protein HPr [Pelosinus sp.]
MEFNLEIQNQAGLHARPAAMFAQKASSFKANIMVSKDGKSANAKSIISIMGLGVKKGDILLVKIDGLDAAEAAAALKKLVEDKFGEE